MLRHILLSLSLCYRPNSRLTRELEKKFSDRHVVFIGQRRMQSKPGRNSRLKQPRPRSRTLKEVHEKTLEDLVYPTEITGKRTRQSTDGNKTIKVFLDPKDATAMEYKLDSFSVGVGYLGLVPRFSTNCDCQRFPGYLQQADGQDCHLPVLSRCVGRLNGAETVNDDLSLSELDYAVPI